MLANTIESVTGLRCEAIDESGECVEVYAPRPFVDDPEVFLYIQKIGDKLLLTDDSEVYAYHGHCKEAVNEMAAIVHAAGLEFSNASINLRCELEGLGPAVEKFLAVMSSLASREQDFNRMWAINRSDQDALAANK